MIAIKKKSMIRKKRKRENGTIGKMKIQKEVEIEWENNY